MIQAKQDWNDLEESVSRAQGNLHLDTCQGPKFLDDIKLMLPPQN